MLLAVHLSILHADSGETALLVGRAVCSEAVVKEEDPFVCLQRHSGYAPHSLLSYLQASCMKASERMLPALKAPLYQFF